MLDIDQSQMEYGELVSKWHKNHLGYLPDVVKFKQTP